ncbi:hypothetical protein [Candidatus Syntrophosphaera thermopropionivorans]|jgi:hypothetical protein|uniref:Uncharacterized protein n=1 Tax=Candidatus Syntrophosphaera thermopropionivorans TaxID=2593015 RepID=A0AC61QJM7_9BACT|nr:hypothetical protein [Candidatus Syntrophosphaera thermopropionivorans]TDF73270.1 hypothetical protein E0946_03615 [Candidatus Syntrophosphaera thermopropionivorans]HRD00387.1 hypothetical protein [Candidatus Syntrophosphaera thermopropionivorans]
MSRYNEIDLSKIHFASVQNRFSKVDTSSFAQVSDNLLDSMPDILKGAEFKEFIKRCRLARDSHKTFIIGLGGHIIKCGLAPLLIKLMEEGIAKCFAVNGSVTIHDFELAYFGKTSEDVSKGLADGTFGMAEETINAINRIIIRASEEKLGYGEALGKDILENAPNSEISLLAQAYKYNIPVTVHIALGTDITHQSLYADGKAIGDCSMRDFRIFCEQVKNLNDGGVFINMGSAVIIPEVFLKALTVARNVYGTIQDFTTAVFDMNQQYRELENVVRRPVEKGGKGYYFIGHHEIMIPLLVQELLR